MRAMKQGWRLWAMIWIGLILGLGFSACKKKNSETGKRVIVLGIDGMDLRLLKQLLAEGTMPHFQRLIQEGGFRPLGTSSPPESPVAWSNFITGMNPGRHGIYDFIHRDPQKKLDLYLSTSRTVDPPESITCTLGDFVIWLAGGRGEWLRDPR